MLLIIIVLWQLLWCHHTESVGCKESLLSEEKESQNGWSGFGMCGPVVASYYRAFLTGC